MSMTIAQVLYVLEIADCRSISAAAERQFISQSALSQQIQRLEGELGYPLFVRTPRGLTLTAAGETFCREARPVAEQWQRLCSAVKPDGRRGRRLRIGMGARVYSNRLFQDIARYFDSHPEIDVTFVTEAGLDVLAGLRDGSIDLALDRLPAGEEGDPSLFVCDLVQERQCVLMSPDDPRAALPWLSFGDLQGCNMISGLENSAEDRMLRRTCQTVRHFSQPRLPLRRHRYEHAPCARRHGRCARARIVRFLLRRVGRAAASGDICVAEIHLSAERHEEEGRTAVPLLSLRCLPQTRDGL